MAGVFKTEADRRKRGAPWRIWWRDGGERRWGVGYPDKEQSLALARLREAEAKATADGLRDPAAERLAEHARRPIGEHLGDWRAHLSAKGSGVAHVAQSVAYVQASIDALEWASVRDIEAAALVKRLGDLRATEGTGARTYNARLTAHKAFTRWLTTHGRLVADPLAVARRVRESDDRRWVRRLLTSDEHARLVTVAKGAPTAWGMTGEARSMLYRVLGATGLRASEAASLRRESFTDEPGGGLLVTVEAAYSKRKRSDTLPIPASVAGILRPWLGSQRKGVALWPLPDKARQRVLRPDLLRARIRPTITTDREGVKVRAVIDFHSFRHGYVSTLARSGAPVKAVQSLARHSDVKLTLGVYTHLHLGDERAAVEAAFAPAATPEAASVARTGTTDAPVAAGAQHGATPAQHGEGSTGLRLVKPDTSNAKANATRVEKRASGKPCAAGGLGAVGQAKARRVRSAAGNTGEGSRTPNLLIRSQGEIGSGEAPDANPGTCATRAQHRERAGVDCDPDLDAVTRAWVTLPAAVRAGIVAMVWATTGG